MKKIKRNNPFLIFVAVFGLLFFLHIFGALKPLENFLLNITKPLSTYLYRSGNNFDKSYNEKKANIDWQLRAETLAKTVAALEVANSQCREIIDENNKLRGQLNFLSEKGWQAVSASVIAKEVSAETGEEGQALVINRGEVDGLRLGLGVVNEVGIIVGKIIDLKSSTAKVCLTTSPKCQLAAAIQNQDKTQGISDGELGLTIKMNYIPRSEKIMPGDTVVTSGLSGNIPRGLVIGKVSAVQNESNEVWQSANIESLVNLNNLTVVSVIIP